MALAHHVSATATPERLRLASELAGAGAADARMLADIHEMVLRLILTQQIEDIAAGIPPSNAVDTARLGRDQRKTLKQAVERLDVMAEMVRGVLA
jgi:DNA polymerase-3 subunit epsilon/CBS domain-containing protein